MGDDVTRKTVKQLHDDLYQSDLEYAKEYDALEEEFSLAENTIKENPIILGL